MCVHAVAPEAELSAELKEGLELQAGAIMRLKATIKGRPTPRITWAKMNTNIKDRQGIVIKSTNIDTMVMVENVNRYDAGKYILNLDSLAGMKMYTIIVKVLGERRTVIIYLLRKCINISLFALIDWLRPATHGWNHQKQEYVLK